MRVKSKDTLNDFFLNALLHLCHIPKSIDYGMPGFLYIFLNIARCHCSGFAFMVEVYFYYEAKPEVFQAS